MKNGIALYLILIKNTGTAVIKLRYWKSIKQAYTDMISKRYFTSANKVDHK